MPNHSEMMATVVATLERITKTIESIESRLGLTDDRQQAVKELQKPSTPRPDKQPLNPKPPLLVTLTALADEEAEKPNMSALDESALTDVVIEVTDDFAVVQSDSTLIDPMELESVVDVVAESSDDDFSLDVNPYLDQEKSTHIAVTNTVTEVTFEKFPITFLPVRVSALTEIGQVDKEPGFKFSVGKPRDDAKSEIILRDLNFLEHSGPLAICENDSVIFTSVFVTKMNLVGSSCPTQPFKVVPVFVPPPAKPPDKSINMLQMLDSHIISQLLKYVILHGLEGVLFVERSDFDMLSLVRSKHLPSWISSLQTKVTVTLRILSIDLLPPWVLDRSEIKQGNEQLWFQTPFCYLNSTCNSTVCENAPETFHSDFNMLYPLNVSRCTLFNWKYVQLMLEWYLRFLNSYIILWIKENVQRLNVWWLFDLACHIPIRFETETYVLVDLEDVRLVSLNMGSLAAVAKYRGDFEKILRAMTKEVEEIDTNIILFIFEIYLVFSVGKTKGLMEAAHQLQHMLYRSQLRCTNAIPLGEFHQYVEKDTTIGNRSYIAEPSIADTIRILRGLEVKYDSHQDDKALVMAALLLVQYIASLYLPDKATDFGDEVCANVEVHALAREKDKAHVAGGSFTVNRDASNANLEKEIKITLFFKKNQLPFREEWRLQDISKKHDEFIIIYYHMSMTNLDHTDSGWILVRFTGHIRILEFHVCADIYVIISWWLLGTLESYKEVKQLMVLRVRDLWSLATLEENDEWIVYEHNTIFDIHRLRIIHMSSYIDSIVKGLLTMSISYSGSHEEKMQMSQNLITCIVKNVFQSQGFINLESERLLKISPLHLKMDESKDAKKQHEELKTKFKGHYKVIKDVLGLTGDCKAELARALVEKLFDDENFIARIAMCGHMEQHSVAHFTCTPPGYVGHKVGGQFTEVKQQLHYIILFEEIAKGHMSTYLSARLLLELLIKLDEMGMFDPLAHDMLRRIIKLQMKDASCRLTVSDAAWDNVLPQSYDPNHGAKSKCLEKKVVTFLLKMPPWTNRDENSIVFVDVAFGGNGLSCQVEKNGKHVDEAFKSKGIPVIFIAKFGQVHFHQLQYRELSLHIYGLLEDQLLVPWSECSSVAAATWKTIAIIEYEFLIFDLEDKVTFETGSNVTDLATAACFCVQSLAVVLLVAVSTFALHQYSAALSPMLSILAVVPSFPASCCSYSFASCCSYSFVASSCYYK